MRIFAAVCAAALLFAVPGPAGAEVLPLSFDEALAMGLRQNKDVRLFTQDVLKAKAKLAEASSSLLPSVDAQASWTDTHGLYEKDVRSFGADVGLSQVLYQGGRVLNTIAFSEQGVVVAQAALDRAHLETALQVRKAFYASLLSSRLAALNKRILDNSSRHLASMRSRYAAGQASQTDLLRLEQSLAAVSKEYAASLNQEEAGIAQLKNLLALDDSALVLPYGEFFYLPQDLVYDQAFLSAMRDRPEIRQYEAQQKQALKAVEIAKADSRPTVLAAWDYYASSTPPLARSSAVAWNDYQVAGIVVSWPIFDGWAAKHRVQQALADVSRAQIAGERARQDIALEVKTSYLALKSALELIKSAEADVALYKDSSAAAEVKYRSGELSELDADDARLRYEIAVFNKDQALYEYSVAKVTFEKAAGGLR